MTHSSLVRRVSMLCVLVFGAFATACGGSSSNSSTSSSDQSCGCDIDVNGDKQSLTCGQSACIGGSTWSCGDNGATETSADCATAESGSSSSSSSSSSGSSGSSSSSSSTSSSGSDPSTSSNDACSQLATFCSDKCPTPATINDDCVATANGGDSMKCVLWGPVNASLCKK